MLLTIWHVTCTILALAFLARAAWAVHKGS